MAFLLLEMGLVLALIPINTVAFNQLEIAYQFSYTADPLPSNDIDVPGFEYAMRYGDEELGHWNVLKYYTSEECSNTPQEVQLFFNEKTTKLQLRIMLEPDQFSNCVFFDGNFTFTVDGVDSELEAMSLFCNDLPAYLCSQDTTMNMLISGVVIDIGSSLEVICSSTVGNEMAKEPALVLEPFFTGTCPDGGDQCLPLLPVKEEALQIDVSFSMNFVSDGCKSQNTINEGTLVLLRTETGLVDAQVMDTPLHYYHTSQDPSVRSEMGEYPQVEYLRNSTSIIYTSAYNTSIQLNATYLSKNGLSRLNLDLSTNATKLRFIWSQTAHPSKGPNCDVFALEDILIVIKRDQQSRTIMNETFSEDVESKGWELLYVKRDMGDTNCSAEDKYCLFFTGYDVENPGHSVTRSATTLLINIQLLTPIFPPEMHSLAQRLTCSGNNILVNTTFYLKFFQFTQPTPITDSSLNGVELSISTDSGVLWSPIAYYTPVANANWMNFNSSDFTILAPNGDAVAVVSPSVTQLTWATFCIDSTSTKVSIRWKQTSFVGCDDSWVLGSVRVDTPNQQQCLDYPDDQKSDERDEWMVNGGGFGGNVCVQSENDLITFSDCNPREANLTLQLSCQQPTPTPLSSLLFSINPTFSSQSESMQHVKQAHQASLHPTLPSPSESTKPICDITDIHVPHPTTSCFNLTPTGKLRPNELNTSYSTVCFYSTSALGSPNTCITFHPSSSTVMDWSTTPSPSLTPSCPPEPDWISTPVGQNATGTCFNGITSGTRLCGEGGMWQDPVCNITTKFEFALSLIEISPANGLEYILSLEDELTFHEEVYLLSAVLDEEIKSGEGTVDENFSKSFLQVASDVIDKIKTTEQNLQRRQKLPTNDLTRQQQKKAEENVRKTGVLLITTLDMFGLEIHDFNFPFISSSNIEMVVHINRTGPIHASNGTFMYTLPDELLSSSVCPVKVVSFFYKNLTGILLPTIMNQTLVSSVVSVATSCSTCELFETQDVSLEAEDNEKIRVTFTVQEEDLPTGGQSLHCVFLNITTVNSDNFTTANGSEMVPDGEWIEEGCTRIYFEELTIICECLPVGHYGIAIDYHEEVSLASINVITPVSFIFFVTSLLILFITVYLLVIPSTLLNTQSFVHAMLCSNMYLAQFLFLIGVESTESMTVCAGFSVILHYLFIVSYMWVLMEGIVLFLVSYKASPHFQTLSIIVMTTVCYALPMVYMFIVVPCGFLVNTSSLKYGTHYIYSINNDAEICWLSYGTSFIWAYILPVMIIFAVTAMLIVGAFFKAKRVMKPVENFMNQFALTTLTVVVMAVVWILGVVLLSEFASSVAYIWAIFLLLQSGILLTVFVFLDKEVRDIYIKLLLKIHMEFHFFLSFLNKGPNSNSLTVQELMPEDNKQQHPFMEEEDIEVEEKNPKSRKSKTLTKPLIVTSQF